MRRNGLCQLGSCFICTECAGGFLGHDTSLIVRNLSSARCGILSKAPSGNCLVLCHDGCSFLNEATIFFAKTDRLALKSFSRKISYHTSNTNPQAKALIDQ